MRRVTNDPDDFADEAVAGFALANAERVRAVRGGVVRSRPAPSDRVAIVMGGGSGHYPAFAGWVGSGFGHGAACGNTFASPSESQIASVARTAAGRGGILLTPINYAGDVLNFSGAADRLRAEGYDVRTVVITDDIASGSTDERRLRRGIAGSFIILKITGAASELGYSLDELERVCSAVNDATQTLGVALAGCTLPGATEPLFSIPDDQMAIGLGIHGEPGIETRRLGSANDVADALVDALIAERAPVAGERATVLLNGLGAFKYDELYVVYARVHARLSELGIDLVAPVVGEQVTSLDMSGLSLTITYLDPEMETLWAAPCDSVSFSRRAPWPVEERAVEAAAVDAGAEGHIRGTTAATARTVSMTGASTRLARRARDALEAARSSLAAQKDYLGRLDAVAGDGDHGAGMLRGITAACDASGAAVDAGSGAGTLLVRAGEAWSDRAGGTSGVLWGAGLIAMGKALGDETAATADSVFNAIAAFQSEIQRRGEAKVGDKTMVDALEPFVRTFSESTAADFTVAESWERAAEAASSAAANTAGLLPRLGRARIHGERSRGTPDAGAESFALVVTAVASTL